MRSQLICLITVIFIFIMICEPVAALPMLSVPFARAGSYFYLKPSEIADLVILETNTSSIITDDSEAITISFLPSGEGVNGRFTVSPAIAQTSSQTLICDQAYFFRDFTVP